MPAIFVLPLKRKEDISEFFGYLDVKNIRNVKDETVASIHLVTDSFIFLQKSDKIRRNFHENYKIVI